MFTYHRFTTTIYDRAGEGPTLYAGNNLAEAIRAARGVKTGSNQIVEVIDHDKIDGVERGDVCYWNFGDGEELAVDVAEYLC